MILRGWERSPGDALGAAHVLRRGKRVLSSGALTGSRAGIMIWGLAPRARDRM